MMRVGVCRGWRLLALGWLRVELWSVPFGGVIPRHVHRRVASRFVFLDRNLDVHRTGSTTTRALPWLRWYHVPAGCAHWAEARRGRARFLNFEWGPVSASEDFTET